MISRISGTVEEIRQDSVVLDVGGLGYEVLVPGGLAQYTVLLYARCTGNRRCDAT